MAKRAPLPIKTHGNIAATLNATFNTGTRYFATPTEAPLKVICVNGSPPPKQVRSNARIGRDSVAIDIVYKAKPGEHRFVKGSAREAVYNVLREFRDGATLAQLRAKLPTVAGILGALQVLKLRNQVEAL